MAGYRLDARDKDANELVGLADELAQTIRVGHLMLIEQLKLQRALLQFLQNNLKLGDTIGPAARMLGFTMIGCN